MSTDTHRKHVSSKMIPGRQNMHACKAPSLRQSMFNHFHRNFYWPACHFSLIFFSLSPPNFTGEFFEDLSSTLFFFSPLFLTRQILGEVDVKTRQSRDVKNINTIFFYCPEGKEGVQGVGRWGL